MSNTFSTGALMTIDRLAPGMTLSGMIQQGERAQGA
ncbi:hypothetical protein STIAU_0916 [Stigmatella aurantiaca DW4/3-1]|uniref:Uncharacterized protein n=1 Tax=Stigmatella aurantiaca (strain DW4/3-1) TaxID=378806 RepID=Q08YA6_STIAD|nr:hypothetical protein STIAU_0916 [Stigmatella aurantiaca DW4/3-1]